MVIAFTIACALIGAACAAALALILARRGLGGRIDWLSTAIVAGAIGGALFSNDRTVRFENLPRLSALPLESLVFGINFGLFTAAIFGFLKGGRVGAFRWQHALLFASALVFLIDQYDLLGNRN